MPTDIDTIVDALRKDERRHLVLHFHGGLVSKNEGLAISTKLSPVYSPAANKGGYPVFFIWESGTSETIRNNLTELADEPVFKQLLRKLLQYALEKLGAGETGVRGRSFQQQSVGSRAAEAKRELGWFWAAPSKGTIPFRGMQVFATGPQARSTAAAVDDDEIYADLEQDAEFQRSLATLPDLPAATRSAFGGGAAEKDVLVSRKPRRRNSPNNRGPEAMPD